MNKIVLGVADFPPLNAYVPQPHEIERRRRIHISVATYAYEIADKPIMSDAEWDVLAARIDRRMGTAHPIMDEFFRYEFSPMTGMWIHKHPELDGIERLFSRYWSLMGEHFEDLRRRGKLN
jgi:hypothetical protein